LIPLNAWGAFILGLLSRENIKEPVGVLLTSLIFNFYAFAALAMVFILVLTGKDFGPMKKAERRVLEEGKILDDHAKPVVSEEVVGIKRRPGIKPGASNMIIPIGTMIIMMPIGLLVTGKGDITAGSGTTSVFWAVLSASLVAGVLYRIKGMMKIDTIMDIVIKGIGGMVPIMILMMFAFAIGDVTRALKTGDYVAGLASQFLVPAVIPVILFLASCFIAFSTGTSWGTFAIMIPIGVPVAAGMGISLPFILAAILGGGLFGDHCSPISDTTLVASMASACDHIDHVRTQLPYAMIAAAIAAILYLVGGICKI
jgi:Na+/H+ antiporter NhaC